MPNQNIELELTNGNKVNLTINFALLLQIRERYPEVYKRYNDLQTKGREAVKEIFDTLVIIYVGYLCANLNNSPLMGETEFYTLIPYDLYLIKDLTEKLSGAGARKN